MQTLTDSFCGMIGLKEKIITPLYLAFRFGCEGLLKIFNRPGVARAVLQTLLSLIHSLGD